MGNDILIKLWPYKTQRHVSYKWLWFDYDLKNDNNEGHQRLDDAELESALLAEPGKESYSEWKEKILCWICGSFWSPEKSDVIPRNYVWKQKNMLDLWEILVTWEIRCCNSGLRDRMSPLPSLTWLASLLEMEILMSNCSDDLDLDDNYI